jgi:hypothetical protein
VASVTFRTRKAGEERDDLGHRGAGAVVDRGARSEPDPAPSRSSLSDRRRAVPPRSPGATAGRPALCARGALPLKKKENKNVNIKYKKKLKKKEKREKKKIP